MISVKQLLKIYKSGSDSVRAVDGVTIDVAAHEFFVLLGLSGSGKTTLLRCVAGLEKPDGGEIAIGNSLVSAAERGFFLSYARLREVAEHPIDGFSDLANLEHGPRYVRPVSSERQIS